MDSADQLHSRAAEVGARLATLRLRQRRTIADLSNRTRIPVALLEAIEAGDIERLPRGLFQRGHVRAYARELGEEPEDIVRDIWTEPEVTTVAVAPPPAGLDPNPPTLRGVAVRIAAGVVMFAAVLVFARAISNYDAPHDSAVSLPDASDEVATAGRETVGTPTPTSGSSVGARAAVLHASAPASPKLHVGFHATDEVWIQASADGRRVAYNLFPAGSNAAFTADRELVIRIGDAGAVTYTVNGVPGRSLGGRSEVRNVRLTPENLATFSAR